MFQENEEFSEYGHPDCIIEHHNAFSFFKKQESLLKVSPSYPAAVMCQNPQRSQRTQEVISWAALSKVPLFKVH